MVVDKNKLLSQPIFFMKKRTLILIIIAIFFFYGTLFFRNIVFDVLEPNNKNKEQYLFDLKNECQKVMLEIFGDLELLYQKNKASNKNEIEDLEKKFNKLIYYYHGLIKSKNKQELSKNFNSFFYHAELLEYYLNKDLSYLEINEKYQNYIAVFYDVLELTK